jgi:hypothetical protein
MPKTDSPDAYLSLERQPNDGEIDDGKTKKPAKLS